MISIRLTCCLLSIWCALYIADSDLRVNRKSSYHETVIYQPYVCKCMDIHTYIRSYGENKGLTLSPCAICIVPETKGMDMITFAVTTSSDGFDCNVFTVGTYTSVYGTVTVPHYDI